MAKKKTRRPAAAGVTRGEFNALKADVAALANGIQTLQRQILELQQSVAEFQQITGNGFQTANERIDLVKRDLINLAGSLDSAKTETQTALANLTARIDSIVAPGELPADIVEKVTKLREELEALKAEVGGGAFQLPR